MLLLFCFLLCSENTSLGILCKGAKTLLPVFRNPSNLKFPLLSTQVKGRIYLLTKNFFFSLPFFLFDTCQKAQAVVLAV